MKDKIAVVNIDGGDIYNSLVRVAQEFSMAANDPRAFEPILYSLCREILWRYEGVIARAESAVPFH